MLIFHEGLPRSGKSYESLVKRIVPALQAGREVVAYVEGLDAGRIAKVSGVSVERVRELLFVVTREQMLKVEGKRREAIWLQHCRKNALHVFDEAQLFWGNKARLTDEEVQWVSEHGHQGIDVVLMGQDLRDVHALWRRRIETKVCFVKLSMLGAERKYSATTYRQLPVEVWEKVSTVTASYDPRYFGTYKSHVDDETNTANYKDGRATLFGSWLFRLALPATMVAAVVGAVYLWRFFHPEPKAAPAVLAAAPAASQALAGGQVVAAVPKPAAAALATAAPDKRSPIERHLSDLSAKYRLRLAGLARVGQRVAGVLEWMDGGSRVMERLTLDQLRDMGVAVVIGDGFVRIATGAWTDFATMWPVEGDGRISENRLATMRPVERKEEPMQTVPLSLGGSRVDDKPRAAPGEVTEAPQVRPGRAKS